MTGVIIGAFVRIGSRRGARARVGSAAPSARTLTAARGAQGGAALRRQLIPPSGVTSGAPSAVPGHATRSHRAVRCADVPHVAAGPPRQGAARRPDRRRAPPRATRRPRRGSRRPLAGRAPAGPGPGGRLPGATCPADLGGDGSVTGDGGAVVDRLPDLRQHRRSGARRTAGGDRRRRRAGRPQPVDARARADAGCRRGFCPTASPRWVWRCCRWPASGPIWTAAAPRYESTWSPAADHPRRPAGLPRMSYRRFP